MKDLTPRLIEESESKKLGIPHGWYGTRVSGTLMTGPNASLDECLEAIRLLPDVAEKSVSPSLGDIAAASAKPAARPAYSLYSHARVGQIGYKPSRQGNR